MIDIPPDEWIAAAWAMREVAQPKMNVERRAWFESCKCLLFERDMKPSVTHPAEPSKVVGIRGQVVWSRLSSGEVWCL